MSSNGFNPLRHDCAVGGCFNVKHRFRIEQLAPLIPGDGAFGDVDARVEVNNRFLELEFKPRGGTPKRGQERAFEALIRGGRHTVFVVQADCETSEVFSVQVYSAAGISDVEPCDLDGLRRRIASWVGWTQALGLP